MKREVGEYGRTNKGRILVFSWLQDENGKTMNNCVVKYVNGGVIKYWLDEDEKIIKHSKNIIDLIEIGDYVNGYKIVNEIWGEDDNNLYFEIEGGYNTYIAEKDIKSIVTKEQFKEMEYRV